MTDEELLDRYRKNDDEAAVRELYVRVQQPLFAWLLRKYHRLPVEDVEEIRDEAFLSAVRGYLGRNEAKFTTYLFKAADNMAMSRVRKIEHVQTEPIREEMPSPQGSPGEEAECSERFKLFRRVLQKLRGISEKDRYSLSARYVDDVPWTEIAERNGRTVESERVSHSRALRRLRAALLRLGIAPRS